MDFSNPLHIFLAIAGSLVALGLLIWLVVFLVKPSLRRDTFRLAIPLSLSSRRNKKHHVFLGLSDYSKLLATQILQEWKQQKKKRDQGKILFVNLADTFSKTAERQLQQELGSHCVKVFHGSFADADAATLARAIGLEELQPWLKNPRTSLYLFSASPRENARLLSLATDDPTIRAKVYHYASTPDGFDTLVASTGTRVRLLNPHQMSLMHLKLDCPDLMPHHFVQKALDADGTPLGYVDKGLNAMILGFGHTGQEALRFLYEFGSFVGKDSLRAPMSIRVYDPRLAAILGPFLQSAPALKGDSALIWHNESAGTAGFWEAFEQDFNTRYIIVAIDDGPRNIQLGVSLLQAAARSGRDLGQMIILVRNWKESRKEREILDQYNAAYCPEGVRVLRSFGNTTDIWTPDVISGRRLKQTALGFNESQKAQGVDEDWETRRERLSRPGPDALRNRQELRRRQAMDIARALYVPTLKAFAPSGTPAPEQMAYLAAQEHLHSVCALIVTGYTPGPQDELLKRMPGLVPYPDATKESQEQSLLAVKSMLSI